MDNSTGYHSPLGEWSDRYDIAAAHGANDGYAMGIQSPQFANLWMRRFRLSRSLKRKRRRKPEPKPKRSDRIPGAESRQLGASLDSNR